MSYRLLATRTRAMRKCTKYDLSFSWEGVCIAPRTRTTRHSGARSPSSASKWPRFGALVRQVGDRDNVGRPVVGAEERSESLSPASESLDRKRILDKRVVPFRKPRQFAPGRPWVAHPIDGEALGVRTTWGSGSISGALSLIRSAEASLRKFTHNWNTPNRKSCK